MQYYDRFGQNEIIHVCVCVCVCVCVVCVCVPMKFGVGVNSMIVIRVCNIKINASKYYFGKITVLFMPAFNDQNNYVTHC